MKLLVKEIRGYSFRLLDLESNQTYRLMKKEAPSDLVVGSLLTADIETSDDLITDITILDEIIGDSSKARVEVCVDDVKIGDLIDGVPVLNLGKVYAKGGKKMAYAYFK